MTPIQKFLKKSEEEFVRKFLDYYDDGSKNPNLALFDDLKSFLRRSHLELLEVVEGTAKKVMKDVKVLGDVTGLWKHGYNQALSDFLDLIRGGKE